MEHAAIVRNRREWPTPRPVSGGLTGTNPQRGGQEDATTVDARLLGSVDRRRRGTVRRRSSLLLAARRHEHARGGIMWAARIPRRQRCGSPMIHGTVADQTDLNSRPYGALAVARAKCLLPRTLDTRRSAHAHRPEATLKPARYNGHNPAANLGRHRVGTAQTERAITTRSARSSTQPASIAAPRRWPT